jgi:hypothetical protein
MLWYSKACFRVRKHGTHHPKLVITCVTDHLALGALVRCHASRGKRSLLESGDHGRDSLPKVSFPGSRLYKISEVRVWFDFRSSETAT